MQGLNQIRAINDTYTAQYQADRINARIANEHGADLTDEEYDAAYRSVEDVLFPNGVIRGTKGLAQVSYSRTRDAA